MNHICKYCAAPASFPPKTKWSGWCCSPTFYQCQGYKAKTRITTPPWNKGRRADNDDRLLEKANRAKGRKIGGVKQHSNETKLKIAISMRGNNNGKHRGDRQSYYNGIRMDSSWEVKVATYLDSKDIKWKYGETIFVLSNNRSYRPDFVLECGKIIEVKGYWRKANREKFDLWRKLYPDIICEIWDKSVLKDLELI